MPTLHEIVAYFSAIELRIANLFHAEFILQGYSIATPPQIWFVQRY